MNELFIDLFKQWKWDAFHIGATLFCILIIWRIIMMGIESRKINQDEKKKKAAREAKMKANVELRNKTTNGKENT
jgi:flagellar biosynthesis/type III secretory pathway M-ring protein FliF/YscJ